MFMNRAIVRSKQYIKQSFSIRVQSLILSWFEKTYLHVVGRLKHVPETMQLVLNMAVTIYRISGLYRLGRVSFAVCTDLCLELRILIYKRYFVTLIVFQLEGTPFINIKDKHVYCSKIERATSR